MDISREEQRVLHALAKGGQIEAAKNGRRIGSLRLVTREGWRLGCELTLFRKLKRKRAIASSGGLPYRITRRGLELVRAQADNR